MSKPMTRHAFPPLLGLPFAAALILGAAGASAQTPPAMPGMDHAGHGAVGGTGHEGMGHEGKGHGGMMGDMDKMKPMMHKMMSAMAVSADERIAALKDSLKITDAQAALWKPFADALKNAAETMHHAHHDMMPPEPAAAPASAPDAASAPAKEIFGDKDFPGASAIKKMGAGSEPAASSAPAGAPAAASSASTLPERLAHFDEALSEHLGSLKKIKAALDPLYAAFSDEQKKIADGLMVGPMGVM